MRSDHPSTTTPTGSASRVALPLMAVAAGLSVAGNYFAQPLLGVLQDDLGLSPSAASLTVGVAQVGYAAGLAVLVPMGDRWPRRELAAVLLAATAVFLTAGALAPTGGWLLAATLLAALTSVGAQILVPFAAALARPDRRARAVGTVMSGVLVGGLAARALAGLLADLWGWRSIYWVTAVLLVAMAVVVRRALPTSEPPAPAGIGGWRSVVALLRSTAALLVQLPGLRRPVALAAAAMAGYTVHLSVLTLLLSAPPYRWSPSAIGLLGLVGLLGLISFPIIGRIVDAGHRRATVVVGLGLSTGAWVLMLPAGDGHLAWLVVGIALLNLGQQAVLNATQTEAYELRPDARSRINAVFMTLFFAGGALGGGAASLVWSAAGWRGACLLGATLVGTGLLAALLRVLPVRR